ncbi:coiled-coil domain-containing protein [Candidatus Palauibacter sp.]|uniref:coiled-coil domain-containing protein n=1 Tax=Candidatus Palauibacter sp. TaxID=3101350 RepID=UPI003B021F5D
MLDTHAVARALTAADFTPAQADALTDALREFTEQGDHVTSDQFKAGQAEVRSEIAELRSEQRIQMAEVRTEIANLDTRLSTQIAGVRTEISSLETRLIRWMVGTVLTTVALTVGILRFLAGSGG